MEYQYCMFKRLSSDHPVFVSEKCDRNSSENHRNDPKTRSDMVQRELAVEPCSISHKHLIRTDFPKRLVSYASSEN